MKEIHLTRGMVAIVDDGDYDWLSQWKWQFKKSGYASRALYGGRKDGKHKTKTRFMHHEIIAIQDGEFIDHINGNPLDNRRENLRKCTHRQNMMNRKPLSSSTSRYKGVSYDQSRKKWRSGITSNGKSLNLGRYSTENEAAAAYNFAAIKHFGEFARLNCV